MVIWTQPARNDLHAIFEFIAMDSKVYARNTVRNIVERASNLINHPQIGRIAPELENSDIREVFIYSYRIIYQIFPDTIAVLTVVHGNRDLNKNDITVELEALIARESAKRLAKLGGTEKGLQDIKRRKLD